MRRPPEGSGPALGLGFERGKASPVAVRMQGSPFGRLHPIALLMKVVPLAGIEPALLAESDFESDASTSSAIGARAEADGGDINRRAAEGQRRLRIPQDRRARALRSRRRGRQRPQALAAWTWRTGTA